MRAPRSLTLQKRSPQPASCGISRGTRLAFNVCSLGELMTAERAGFTPERITLHGAGKSDEELAAAAAGRIGRIAVDGIEEMERLAGISRNGGATVLLRLNVRVEAGQHAFVRTGGDDTKFGIHARDEEAAVAILAANPQLRFAGLHAHIGSQVYESAAYAANAAALFDAAQRFAERGLTSSEIVMGGGFGVPSHPDAVPEQLDVAAAISSAARCVRDAASERGLPSPRLGIEPGRSIVALAGTTIYRVLARKRQTSRTFVVVNGGIAENPRPALYGAHHHVVPVARPEGELEEVTLCGRSCENDELGTVELPHDVRAGALLAMCSTGAYTYSMAGNYNRVTRPAVVGLAGGSHHLLARRENLDEVLARDALD